MSRSEKVRLGFTVAMLVLPEEPATSLKVTLYSRYGCKTVYRVVRMHLMPVMVSTPAAVYPDLHTQALEPSNSMLGSVWCRRP